MAILLLDTTIEMQSVLDTAKTITAISQAAEAVVTGTHDFIAGDLIVIDAVVGMTEINKRVVRVLSVNTTVDFTCEALDSTGFTAYASGGTAEKVTTFLAFDNATSFNYPEPTPNRIDVTTIHVNTKVEVFGLDDAPQITIPLIADPFAAHVVEMRAASIAKTNRVFRITMQNGNILIMNAAVAGGRGFDGAVGAVGTGQAALTLAATEQWFAS
tara:strand:+ start:8939 stop:9580 length:642 start_codon:yes stop_codon:yes gene_type:complete